MTSGSPTPAFVLPRN